MEKAEEVEEEVLDSCSDEVARCHGVVGCKGAKPRFQGGFFLLAVICRKVIIAYHTLPFAKSRLLHCCR